MTSQRISLHGIYLCLCVLWIFLIDSNFSKVLGLSDMVMAASYTPFLLYFIYYLWENGLKKTRNSNIYFSIVTLGFICIITRFIILKQDYIKTCLYFFIFPYLVAYCLDSINQSEQKLLRKVILLILFIEVGLAIYERLTLSVVLAKEDSYVLMLSSGNAWSFRSSALYGHPLANAFIVMIITFFITASNYSLYRKAFLLIICFAGLFCFNERGNILVTAIGSIFILVTQYKKLSFRQKKTFKIVWFIVIVASLYILTNSDFGGRVFMNERSITDDSGARIASLFSFSFLSTDQLLWGGENIYEKVLKFLKFSYKGVAGIENGYVMIILRYGLLFGAPIIFLLTKMQNQLLKSYSKVIKWTIITCFAVMAFTNPHIANVYPWFTFIVSFYAFTPYNILTQSK